MPRYWHDRHSVNQIEDPEEKRFQLSIVADKKPYFMRIVYPTLARQYNTYIKTANRNARREFGISIDELEQIGVQDRTERQNDFLRYFYNRIPVGIGDCVMNKICRRFEQEFDGYLKKHVPENPFDLSVLKSDAEYTRGEFREIEKYYDKYRKRLQQFVVFRTYERVDDYDAVAYMEELKNEFMQNCDIACPNHKSQCNAMLDLCYTRSYSKKFAWELCGDQMIENLLEKNGRKLVYPAMRDDGDIQFRGCRFGVEEIIMEEDNGDCIE